MYSFSSRQLLIAASSAVADDYAATAAVYDIIYFKAPLEFFGFNVTAALLMRRRSRIACAN